MSYVGEGGKSRESIKESPGLSYNARYENYNRARLRKADSHYHGEGSKSDKVIYDQGWIVCSTEALYQPYMCMRLAISCSRQVIDNPDAHIYTCLILSSKARTSRPASPPKPTLHQYSSVQVLGGPPVLAVLGHLVLRAAVPGLALVAFIGEPFLEAHLAAFAQRLVVRVLGLFVLGQAAAGPPWVVGSPLLFVASDLDGGVSGGF